MSYRQHAVRLVPAGRLSVPAALARRPALRRARLRQHATSAWCRTASCSRRDFPLLLSALAEPRHHDDRLEPERVLAPARAVRLGRRARRADRPAACSCSTSMPSARTARTSSRRPTMNALIRRPRASLLALAFAAARARGHQGAGHDVRLGRARHRTRRRQGQRLHRDQRAAGRAPRRRQAEPRRAGAHRRPRRRDRRRARDRLAAGAAAGVGQFAASSPDRRATSRRPRRCTCSTSRPRSIARWATSIRSAIRTCNSTRATSRWWRRR